MANDRLDGRELPLTHNLLAIMLGVRRPAVSVAVQALERKGLIRAGRRVITVRDRKGLMAASCGRTISDICLRNLHSTNVHQGAAEPRVVKVHGERTIP